MKILSVKIFLIGIVVCIALYVGVFLGRISRGNMWHVSDSATSNSSTQSHQTDTKYSLNINTATKEQLLELPGVTPSVADEIIQYREEYGDFVAIRELLELDTITDNIYQQIKSLVHT